jgi:hypothetical protein
MVGRSSVLGRFSGGIRAKLPPSAYAFIPLPSWQTASIRWCGEIEDDDDDDDDDGKTALNTYEPWAGLCFIGRFGPQIGHVQTT